LRPRAISHPLILAAIALSAAAFAGCRGCEAPPRDLPERAASAPAPVPKAPTARELVHLVDELPGCDLEHRGLLFDAGPGALPGRAPWEGPANAAPQLNLGVAPRGGGSARVDGRADPARSGFVQAPAKPGVEAVEHDGSTWARVYDRQIKLTFALPEASPIFVALRAEGIASRTATVSIDDYVMGTVRLQRDQIKIVTTATTSLPVDPGLHTLTLRFSGRSTGGQAFADLDWIRLGVPDELPAAYGAPTLRDVVAPGAALGGVPHRSISLRVPGAVRCPVRPARATKLRAAVGVLGPGEGDAEIRVVRDGKEPLTLRTVHVVGGDKATWTDVEVPLDAFAGQVISLELRASTTGSVRGGRVLFGDPVLVGPPEPPPVAPPARAVVVVALNGVERADLPPWSGRADPQLPTLSELAATATTFDRHRAPSTAVRAVMASLLTGLPPQAHTVGDLGARLPERITTIGAIARDSGIRTAMLTGVPTTFGAFGFGAAWEKFLEHPPASGNPATTPIDAATAWIAETAREGRDVRILAIVHARGGHPPWEVAPKELAALKPPDYAGPIEPRRAGQVLARIRASRRRAQILTADDRDRMRDLAAIALGGQDRAIGALIAALKAAGLWDETLLVVTGDVSSGRSDQALYGDAVDLTEPPLTLPLYVHFPGDLYAGQRVDLATEIVDIPRTALAALGLGFTPGRRVLGRDLTSVASGREGIKREPQVAILGDRYSTRWGALVLFGRFGAAPFLCDLALDPTCAFNRRDLMPLATMALFRRTLAFDTETRAPSSQREPATVDPETAAQLSVWGAE